MVDLKTRIRAFLHPDEVKVNPTYQSLIMYADTPQPLTTPKNYKAFAVEGYQNDTVYKCISYISRNGGAIPPALYTDVSKQKQIKSHPILDKLNTPNTEQSGVAYREYCLAYKLLTGNNYQYAIRANTAANGPPDELWCLRPDWVEIIADRNKGIVGYKHQFMPEPIPAMNIGHTKYFNPDDSVYGLSPVQVASILIDMQTGTRKWDLALVQNSARPSGAWTVPTPLSKNDRDRLESRLKEKLAGYRNAGAPPVLDAGLTWQSISQSPAELDWLESIKYNAVLIANIFNMPPQLVGDTSSTTYNNYEEAKAASYTEAIFPDLDDLYALWNMWLVPMYPDLKAKGACLYYDKESVEVVQRAVQAQKTAQAQRAVAAYLGGACTLNQALVMQGLPEDPQGDVYRIGLVLIPASKLMEYAEQSMTEPAAPPVPVAELGPDGLPLPVVPPPASTQKVPPPPNKPVQRVPGKTKDDLWQADNTDKIIQAYRDQGVTHLQWLTQNSACELCAQNADVIRETGKAFPTGNIIAPLHPNCECMLVPVDMNKQAQRLGYRAFMEASCK